MNALEEVAGTCPCCGEPVTLLVDTSQAPCDYVEDCEVCCRPMRVELTLRNDQPVVSLRGESD